MFDDTLRFLCVLAQRALAEDLGLDPGPHLVDLTPLAGASRLPQGLGLTFLRANREQLRSEQRFRSTKGGLEALPPQSFRLLVLVSANPEQDYHQALDLLGRFTAWVVANPVFAEDHLPELQGHPIDRILVQLAELPLADELALWQALQVPVMPAVVLEVRVQAFGEEGRPELAAADPVADAGPTEA